MPAGIILYEKKRGAALFGYWQYPFYIIGFFYKNLPLVFNTFPKKRKCNSPERRIA
jgi:hypothetical protein